MFLLFRLCWCIISGGGLTRPWRSISGPPENFQSQCHECSSWQPKCLSFVQLYKYSPTLEKRADTQNPDCNLLCNVVLQYHVQYQFYTLYNTSLWLLCTMDIVTISLGFELTLYFMAQAPFLDSANFTYISYLFSFVLMHLITFCNVLFISPLIKKLFYVYWCPFTITVLQ